MPTDTTVPGAAPDLERRRFLARLSIVLAAGAATLVAIPVVGFLIGPLLRRGPQVWAEVADVSSVPIGTTIKVSFSDPSPLPWAGVTAQTAAWLRRVSDNEFIALAMNCTHLGCPVRWLPDASLFMCPCHGGVYYADGRVAGGPPPRPLFRYPVRVRDGKVEIQAGGVPIE
ncbi:MAG TPA: ubiquinol-cytochrome c reductase iron-sulfur subunit [Candidatus Binataceae bacterium]|nr:ubiquinol-cytochrome c reductase iron-sulfur subunit [Candidatus Binataceae bacterium]